MVLTKENFKRLAPAMKAFLKEHKWICVCGLAEALLFFALLGAGAYQYWHFCQPKFHDLTVELGTENINIEAFMTEYADIKKAGIVTDLSTVDIGVTGSTLLTLRNGEKEEAVTLTVEDTTPPKVDFISWLQKPPDYEPDARDFVASCTDMSDVAFRFVGNVVIPLDYRDQSFVVVAEDASGNSVSHICTLSVNWLADEYTLELGETLTRENLLLNPERDGCRIEQGDIDVINGSGIGEYTVTSPVDQSVCLVHVVDTRPPELKLKDISVYEGEEVTVDSFVESCFDVSGDVSLRLITEPDVNTLGIQTMTIEATDIHGNTVTSTATLAVVLDKTPPKIQGLKTLRVAKNSEPDYLAGVSAKDDKGVACKVTCDSSGVDLTKTGTYYVTYTAKDKSGNTATAKRTVVVEHDQADTDALAASIAAELPSDPEAIRDYVRDTIRYNHNSGGDDPVWYGFNNRVGDCLVHALCLQSLLTIKGYETQLIWVTDRSHYWLIIKLDGVWRHIDATPGTRHTKYSLMTDEQRLSILQGRDWDHSAWPACE